MQTGILRHPNDIQFTGRSIRKHIPVVFLENVKPFVPTNNRVAWRRSISRGGPTTLLRLASHQWPSKLSRLHAVRRSP